MKEQAAESPALVAELEALLASSRLQRAALRDLLAVVLERLDAAPSEALRG